MICTRHRCRYCHISSANNDPIFIYILLLTCIMTLCNFLVLILVVNLVLAFYSVAARLRPVVVRSNEYRNEPQILSVCRTTVEDLHQPFELVVFALAIDPPAGFLRRVHETVGAAVLLTNSENKNLDSQVTSIFKII